MLSLPQRGSAADIFCLPLLMIFIADARENDDQRFRRLRKDAATEHSFFRALQREQQR